MTLLAASGFGIAAFSRLPADSEVWATADDGSLYRFLFDYDRWQQLGFQFDHPAWISVFGRMGVAFWDLIQPCFMFMVGVSMPYSYARRAKDGESERRRALHAFSRSIALVLMGVFLGSLSATRTNWIFTNVLGQIGLGYFIAYLLMRLSDKASARRASSDTNSPEDRSLIRRGLVLLVGLIVVVSSNWLLFRFNPPPANFDYSTVSTDPSPEANQVFTGSFAPWSKNSNIAHRFDMWLLPKLRQSDAQVAAPESQSALGKVFFSNPDRWTHQSGGYATLNFWPSIGTTLLGIFCGQLLLFSKHRWINLSVLITLGTFCMLVGLAGHATICPIIKRIWTPSWVFFSGAYAIWMLAGFYLLFDLLPFKRLSFPLVVVGMNSMLMYMLGQLFNGWTNEKIVRIHLAGLLEAIFGSDALNPDSWGRLIQPSVVFLIYWLFALWLYRQKIFLRV